MQLAEFTAQPTAQPIADFGEICFGTVVMTAPGKNRIMIFGPKDDGTYVPLPSSWAVLAVRLIASTFPAAPEPGNCNYNSCVHPGFL